MALILRNFTEFGSSRGGALRKVVKVRKLSPTEMELKASTLLRYIT